mmetsp:Transcript_2604/g.6570  ORF Transcript_2604/g.6570 Transcript_2604/m.6570 type:complete len:160 (-) Transcript_2604:1877-2356(-)
MDWRKFGDSHVCAISRKENNDCDAIWSRLNRLGSKFPTQTMLTYARRLMSTSREREKAKSKPDPITERDSTLLLLLLLHLIHKYKQHKQHKQQHKHNNNMFNRQDTCPMEHSHSIVVVVEPLGINHINISNLEQDQDQPTFPVEAEQEQVILEAEAVEV